MDRTRIPLIQVRKFKKYFLNFLKTLILFLRFEGSDDVNCDYLGTCYDGKLMRKKSLTKSLILPFCMFKIG